MDDHGGLRDTGRPRRTRRRDAHRHGDEAVRRYCPRPDCPACRLAEERDRIRGRRSDQP